MQRNKTIIMPLKKRKIVHKNKKNKMIFEKQQKRVFLTITMEDIAFILEPNTIAKGENRIYVILDA